MSVYVQSLYRMLHFYDVKLMFYHLRLLVMSSLSSHGMRVGNLSIGYRPLTSPEKSLKGRKGKPHGSIRELSFFTGRGGVCLWSRQFFLVSPLACAKKFWSPPRHVQKNSGPPLCLRKKNLVSPSWKNSPSQKSWNDPNDNACALWWLN